jgi:cytochrome c-type biogenesis protein CcmH/NrfG
MESEADLEPFLYEFGYCCYQEGRFQKAVDIFRTCTIIDPKKSRNWLALGSALMMAGSEGDAIQPLMMAESLDPEDFRAKLFRAQCLVAKQRSHEAFVLLEELEAQFGKNKELQKSIEVLRLQINNRK